MNGAMGRVWVLDLDPSGTGAEMRPLDSVLEKPKAKPDLALVRPKSRPKPEAKPEPREPRRFKVVDVMTGQVKAEDASARATVELLAGERRLADVQVYVWETAGERWRLLTLGEQRTLWSAARSDG
jgi:hypothetical protein